MAKRWNKRTPAVKQTNVYKGRGRTTALLRGPASLLSKNGKVFAEMRTYTARSHAIEERQRYNEYGSKRIKKQQNNWLLVGKLKNMCMTKLFWRTKIIYRHERSYVMLNEKILLANISSVVV